MRMPFCATAVALSVLAGAVPLAHAQDPSDTEWLAVSRVNVTLPYGVMDDYPAGLPFAVESERVPGAVTEQMPFGFPPAHLRLQTRSGAPDPRPTTNFMLKSEVATISPEIQGTLRYQRGSNRFESPWIVMLTDPRASIRWTPAIADKAAVGCLRCERPPHVAGKTEADGVYEVWAHGRTILARPEKGIVGSYAYLGEPRRLENRVTTDLADTVRVADKVLPSKVPPMYGTQVVQNVLVHSGELVREARDLEIRGRGLDFILQRHYSSAVYSFGPLGRNFDSPLFARVQWLPSGALLYYDGTGRVQRFAKDLTPDTGVFLRARNTPTGVAIGYPDSSFHHFDQYGRLAEIVDRNATKPDGSDGNRMRFSYDADGRLATVVDSVGRSVRFSYFAPISAARDGAYPGLLSTVTDFDGRVVRYEYDGYGRLVKVTRPDPGSLRSEQQTTTYVWGPAPTSGNFRLDVLRSGQIISEKDGEGRTIFTATYAGEDAWRVESIATGGGRWSFAHTDSAMTVIDPNGHARTYGFDTAGHVTSIGEPDGATTRYAFDTEGRLTTVVRPTGTVMPLAGATTFKYAASSGDKRVMLNVTEIRQLPRPGSDEAAAGMTRTTSVEYGAHNQPTKIVEPRGTTIIVRDERGNPTSVTDAVGITTTFEFNTRGQLTKVADPRGGATTYVYYSDAPRSAYLESETSGGNTIRYDVDARGNLTKLAQPNGAVTAYVVNALDQVEEERGEARTAVVSYDATGGLISHSVVAGVDSTGAPIFSVTMLETDETGRVKVRTEDGVMTQYGYDAVGNLTTLARSAEALINNEYDNRNRLVAVTQGTRTTRYGYDDDNVQVTVTNALGKTWTKLLNGFGERVGEKDPVGISHVSTTDPAGRPVDSRMVKTTAAGENLLLRWSQREFDPLGRVTREVRKLFTSPLPIPVTGDPVGATDIVTTTVYNDAERKVTRTDPRGIATVTEFDDMGRIARVTDGAENVVGTTYDANGNRLTEKRIERAPDGSTISYSKRFEYDGENRVIAVVDTSDPSREITTSYRYDPRGNLSGITDPDQGTRRYEYDLQGNRTKEIDAQGGVTEYRYDDAGRLREIADANGNLTVFATDEYGNVIEEKRADDSKWSMTYDANNNQKTITDPNGTIITFSYDDANRLISKAIARGANVLGPATVIFTLDDLGRVIGTETSEGVRTAATFDSIDRRLTETQQSGSGPARTVITAYDVADNEIGVTYPSGLVLTRTADPLGRVASITQSGTIAPIVSYRDTGRRLVGRSLENGLSSAWTYDARAQLSGINDALNGEITRAIVYERTQGGRKSAAKRLDFAKQWTYQYDRNGSITSETVLKLDTDVNPLLAWTEYIIDPALNYRKITRTMQTTETSTATVSETALNVRNQYTWFGAQDLGYDPNGNLVQIGGATLQYDAENRLAKATLTDGSVIENLYDAHGRKVQERMTSGGATATRDYVFSGDRVIEEYGEGTLAARYVRGRGIDEIVRAEINGAALYPLQDELGSVDRLTDVAGATLERYEYEGYGKFRVFAPDGTERSASGFAWRWLFEGREYNRALGAYDFRARTLWPAFGRFGQEDMLLHEMPESPNLYQSLRLAYANRTDPTGRWTVDPAVDKPALRNAMGVARELYRVYNLRSVYKRINPEFDAEFLKDGTPPRLTALIGGGANLQNPIWNNVEINTLLLRTALKHNGAKATLTVGLLHEQAHAEGKLAGRADSVLGFYSWHDRYYIPDQIHLGWLTDQVIYDGALFIYHPDKAEYTFMSAKALDKSPAAQIVDIRNGKKRFTRWFGQIADAIGVVYDHKNRHNLLVNPDTGKPLNPIEELLNQ